jgi:hypothetical protein
MYLHRRRPKFGRALVGHQPVMDRMMGCNSMVAGCHDATVCGGDPIFHSLDL